MKKSCLLLVVVLLVIGGVVHAASNPKVLLLMQEKSIDTGFMIKNEVKPMIRLLSEAGYNVTIASESGAKLGYGDVVIVPDLKFDQVDIADYVGLIIPCMAVVETRDTIPARAVEIVAVAFERGLPIAAQNSAVTIVGQARVLQGKKYSIGHEDLMYLVPGGLYQGNGIVRDGGIVTSGICPWLARAGKGKDGTVGLTTTFINMLQEGVSVTVPGT